jgi:hypothetical protein
VRKLVPALVGAVLVVGGVASPAMAAENDGPSIAWAGSIEEDLGRIQVKAASEAGITGLVAHIVPPGGGNEVAAVSSFHLDSGTAQDGVWHSDEVILPELGWYTLNVEATDAAGGHTELDGAGTLSYVVKMYYDGLKTTAAVSFSQRVYHVSGKLMGRWPGTLATAPIAGMPVQASIPGGSFTDVVDTGKKGQFSLAGTVTSTDNTYGYISTGYAPDRPYLLQGYAQLPFPTVKQSPTKVTVHLDRNSVVSEDPIVVSGDATWKSPDGWAPFANARIAIGACYPGTTDPSNCMNGPSTTTDANGHYSYTINPYLSDRIAVAVATDDMYFQTVAYATAKITVTMPTSFGTFSAVRVPETGAVRLNSQGLELTGYSPDDVVVNAQFSQNGVTGWRTVEAIDLGYNAGSSFEREYDHPGAGYWRLTYAGVKGQLAPAQTPAVYVA